MTNYTLKTGAASIVLGPGYFGKYYSIKKNKLLKVTNGKQDDENILDRIRYIKDTQKFYSIIDKTYFVISNQDKFYQELKILVKKEKMTIFKDKILKCYYIENGGMDLLDTINPICEKLDFKYWKSYNKILKFIKHILLALKYLHDANIAHLDIKPENILIKNGKCKLIDFGFSDIYPFNKYINNIKGTPGYFPRFISEDQPLDFLPRIDANDTMEINGKMPMKNDSKLVYKIDSFCLGRTILLLKNVYDSYQYYGCFNFELKKGIKIDKIIKDLVKRNVYQRITIQDCLKKYFN